MILETEQRRGPLSEVLHGLLGFPQSSEQIRLRANISDRIRILLNRQKRQRSDVGKYNIALKLRQDVVNERVIDWTIGKEISSQSCTLDACAGPGGSFQAVTRRGGQWVGNEIAVDTARYLQSIGATVHIGSAEKLEFNDATFNSVVFIFAMNNIQATGSVMKEACRVLKPNGSVVICDPGPTKWIANLVLYGAWKGGKVPEKLYDTISHNSSFKNNIPDFYEKYCPVDPREYASKILEGLFDLDLDAVTTILEKVHAYIITNYPDDFSPKRLERVWSEVLNAAYWGVILNHAQQYGFLTEKVGVLSVHMPANTQNWEVSNVRELDQSGQPREMAEMIYRLRNNQHNLSGQLIHPNGQKVQSNIISPILHLRKKP